MVSRSLGTRPSAGVSSLVAPVPPVRLDQVGREDLAGVEGDDRDLLLVDDGQDAPAGMDCADLACVEEARLSYQMVSHPKCTETDYWLQPGEPGQSALHTLSGELPLTEPAFSRSNTANIAAMKTPPPVPPAVLLWTELPSLSLTTLSPT